jgi:hypothetical protein
LERQYQRPTPAYASTTHPSTTPYDATARSREETLSHVYAEQNGEDQEPELYRDW